MNEILLVAALCCTACASLQHGPLETIVVQSEPAGADVAITCGGQRVASGVTPANLTIPRRSDSCDAVLTKAGYAAAHVPLDRGFSPPFWADVVMTCAFGLVPGFAFGGRGDIAGPAAAIGTAGIVSWIRDRGTGAMYDHSPAIIRVQLQPLR